ncbi:MAG: hypothetical protein mread185_000238 [Mycoplasmataceae bacterium]|nr:MAG: hypothetical protein mread185_000238 [Mycoplasmataceae bacterium]
MNKLSRISRIIRFKTERKIYDDDASKNRPHLVLEFFNKEFEISILFVSAKEERKGLWKQYSIKERGLCLPNESFVNIKSPINLSLASRKIEKKIEQCYKCSPFCLQEPEFSIILNLQNVWKLSNSDVKIFTLKDKDLEEK